ncbi:short-chain dehydrogenase/reductase SDR [Shewanella halifaxensis HAW-EB4]|uniref:Short-chain dehydrogenase/reductase SDR n=1 Tax=Shewanella halifaxensis (strain HAW-EB4) TaxID=458817 RepID=B0TTV0_SHEHH|nr:SDR family oxidoreductase [Shewanella halifaxensis]ABZ76668.1 short-chain dehydrogenase/reductase SDR [Shewanella halifaxensis HAW-EB4]
MQIDYQNKVVLVTGGTKGIGAGIATEFLAAGAKVIVCGRSEPQTLPRDGNNIAQFIYADLKKQEDIETLFDIIATEYPRLDVVINNAGGSPFALADKASPRFHESILRLNLIAPLNVAQQANLVMQNQESGGSIVFIGSISALRASPGTAAYGAAKAAILSLVQSLAVEWAPKVKVMAVSPGLVKTEQSHLHYGDDEGIAAVAETIPAGRLADPADIGKACLFLASESGVYASGCNLLLNGGGEKPAFLMASKNTK